MPKGKDKPLVRAKLSAIAARIHALHKRTLEDIVTVGQALLEAREIARQGQFRVWLAEQVRVDRPNRAQLYARCRRSRQNQKLFEFECPH